MKPVILISPFSKKLPKSPKNPKNYPHWKEVIENLESDYHIIQIGIAGEDQLVDDFRKDLPISEIKKIMDGAETWIAVDNFFQHFAHLHSKPGIVIWGESDPVIFGYPENKNLLKSRHHLRPDQFGLWDGRTYKEEIFVDPQVVINAVRG